MAKVIFSYDGIEIAIQCAKEDKMKYICYKFASKVDININSLLFIYGGNKINYELTYKQQANSMDSNTNTMKILVYKSDNDGLKCQKCGEIIHLPIIDNLIKYNNDQADKLIEMKNQIDNIINLNDIKDITRKIKLVKIIIDNLISENEKSLKDIQNTINNSGKLKIENNNYNLEIIASDNFNSDEEKNLRYFIIKSVKKYFNYIDVAKCIYNECKQMKGGKWTVGVGERDKFNMHSFYEKCLASNIGPYKIGIYYNS